MPHLLLGCKGPLGHFLLRRACRPARPDDAWGRGAPTPVPGVFLRKGLELGALQVGTPKNLGKFPWTGLGSHFGPAHLGSERLVAHFAAGKFGLRPSPGAILRDALLGREWRNPPDAARGWAHRGCVSDSAASQPQGLFRRRHQRLGPGGTLLPAAWLATCACWTTWFGTSLMR